MKTLPPTPFPGFESPPSVLVIIPLGKCSSPVDNSPTQVARIAQATMCVQQTNGLLCLDSRSHSPRHAVGPCNGLDSRTLVAETRMAFCPKNFFSKSLVLALVCDVHALLHSVTSQAFGRCFTQQKHQLRAQPACSGRRRAICRW